MTEFLLSVTVRRISKLSCSFQKTTVRLIHGLILVVFADVGWDF